MSSQPAHPFRVCSVIDWRLCVCGCVCMCVCVCARARVCVCVCVCVCHLCVTTCVQMCVLLVSVRSSVSHQNHRSDTCKILTSKNYFKNRFNANRSGPPASNLHPITTEEAYDVRQYETDPGFPSNHSKGTGYCQIIRDRSGSHIKSQHSHASFMGP